MPHRIVAWLAEKLGLEARRDGVAGTHFVYIKIPGSVQPIERGEKYEDPLQDSLSARDLGEITGGGSQLGDEHADGSRSMLAKSQTW